MTVVPSSSSIVTTHNYYLSCGSAEDPGEGIPHHPGSFFRRSTLPFMAINSSGKITCDLALEAMRKQPGGQPGKTNTESPS
ncbi:unnamed protein product [Nyctereutes procyonoides]|uniref:(raccoon dog) hypothetical protein n=1 Tax=Nyctereutes procyonoides TaxID=34880 RepID=A0A811Z9K2_NYCPR|nr:unnamed protein product [Nyctereutes procyonoides]